MKIVKNTLILALAVLVCCVGMSDEVKTTKMHATTLGYVPKYGPGFEHFDYVNPNAPKGGTMRFAVIGGYDTFNPYTAKGDFAAGLSAGGNLYETLMTTAEDDIQSQYGLIAESLEVAEDLSFAIFHLRPEARFSDGTPITAEDVKFSFHTLVDHGHPRYAHYYKNVVNAIVLGPHSIKFEFDGPPNRELPQIVGQIAVFSKAYWEDREFEKTTLDPPVSSGPYKISSFEAGRYVVLERDKDYWGEHLPVNVGTNNFDVLRYDYYLDAEVAVEAFKSGEYDIRLENSSLKWATAYDFPALHEGLVKKELLRHERPTGMQAFIFNIRKTKFQDPRVRRALAYCFDFEWSNEKLFYGQYTRTTSYFENSDMASRGLISEEEYDILSPYKDQLPEEVFTQEYTLPTTDGSGNIRENLRKAVMLLEEAGWTVKDNKLTHEKTGEVMEIEFLLGSPGFERIITPFISNLNRVGITASIRTVEQSHYVHRRNNERDFDMLVHVFPQSLSPGNEQRSDWGSEAADQTATDNHIGIKNPVVDEIIEKIVAATTREELIVVCRALDRVLLWNHYVIPAWHINSFRFLWWDKFGRPETRPVYTTGASTWWYDEAKAKQNGLAN